MTNAVEKIKTAVRLLQARWGGVAGWYVLEINLLGED
jgi:hypothetical protein